MPANPVLYFRKLIIRTQTENENIPTNYSSFYEIRGRSLHNMPVNFCLPSDISVCRSISDFPQTLSRKRITDTKPSSRNKRVLSRCDSKALKPWPFCAKVLRRRPNTSARPQETFTFVGKLDALGGQSHEYLPLIKTQVNQ
jgi:hypothetical protein